MNSSSRRTYSSPIRTICVPHTGQIWSSSGSGTTTFSTFRPLKSSSCAAFFLRVCSRITVSPSNRDGSCSTSASSKRFCCPGISSDLLSLEGPKSFFCQIIYLFLKSFLMTGFFVNNKTESFDQFRLLRYHCFQL